MVIKPNFQLDSNSLITMDGAMGTEIHNRGVALDPHTWSAEALATTAGQKVIESIHFDAIKSGAKIIITNTFRTDWLGASSKEAALLACRLARQARARAGAEDGVLIAGSVGPIGDCYTPEDTPSNRVLFNRHREHIRSLQEGGVDYILAETMPTIREAVVVAKLATKAGLPVGVSFCAKHHKGDLLLSKESLKDAVEAITSINGIKLISVGVNCVTPQTATESISYLSKLDIPGRPLISVYAQGMDDSSPVFDDDIIDPYQNYLDQVDKWLEAGAQIIGGCCGVPPSWIETIAQKLTKQHSDEPAVEASEVSLLNVAV
jgi:S-methylmethionine-dependent homocysteine/selenocysteine methylase